MFFKEFYARNSKFLKLILRTSKWKIKDLKIYFSKSPRPKKSSWFLKDSLTLKLQKKNKILKNYQPIIVDLEINKFKEHSRTPRPRVVDFTFFVGLRPRSKQKY